MRCEAEVLRLVYEFERMACCRNPVVMVIVEIDRWRRRPGTREMLLGAVLQGPLHRGELQMDKQRYMSREDWMDIRVVEHWNGGRLLGLQSTRSNWLAEVWEK